MDGKRRGFGCHVCHVCEIEFAGFYKATSSLQCGLCGRGLEEGIRDEKTATTGWQWQKWVYSSTRQTTGKAGGKEEGGLPSTSPTIAN